METCAENNDNRGFYRALLNFAESGINSTNNPVLYQVITSIMPNLRRLQYVSIMLNIGTLKNNCRYFKEIITALEERDPEKGVKAIVEYIMNEKNFALDLVRNSPLAGFIQE